MSPPLPIVINCADAHVSRVRYVLDTLLMAAGIRTAYVSEPPTTGPWLLYGSAKDGSWPLQRCLALAHSPASWSLFDSPLDVASTAVVDDLVVVLPETVTEFDATPDIRFDIVANAFYFLSSWSERIGQRGSETRRLFGNSVFARLHVPQDIVDQYLDRIVSRLRPLCDRLGASKWPQRKWPDDATYAIVLSHDVDFIPTGYFDTLKQGAKTMLRHLVRQRDPADALRASIGLASALMRGADPYGCVPAIIEREKALGVRSSFQVAVGHRHPDDVNYRIEDDRVREYLRVISDSGFDLCLHGSYRSTENPDWYVDEVNLLAQRLGRPIGSRQHFLSFDYDSLFGAQARSGIQYDMSMGYPDQIGPRAGFSYPYFPFCLKTDRPYDVLEIGLFLMDVTLRGYLSLKGARAWASIEDTLGAVKRKRGCVSAVWHPIVFGGARDPGYEQLFWNMIKHVQASGGLATDGRTINDYWRADAHGYWSFSTMSKAAREPTSPSSSARSRTQQS